MSRYYGGWAPYVPVAERRRKAEREMEKLRKKGTVVSPVRIEGRHIARSFWGKAWCDNLESYHDYENRLPRGRTYVRNGSVVDLQIAPREVTAMVSGSSIYKVKVSIGEVAKSHWKTLCADCSGGVESLVELLQGRISKGVMERLCRQDTGLFPRPSEIRFSCSCPDYASMCKHIAAVLYGVGARLDEKPELLFRLRAVDETELLSDLGTALPDSLTERDGAKTLVGDDLAALFDLDMADDGASEVTAPRAVTSADRPRPSGKAVGTKSTGVAPSPARSVVRQAAPIIQKGKPATSPAAKRMTVTAKTASSKAGAVVTLPAPSATRTGTSPGVRRSVPTIQTEKPATGPTAKIVRLEPTAKRTTVTTRAASAKTAAAPATRKANAAPVEPIFTKRDVATKAAPQTRRGSGSAPIAAVALAVTDTKKRSRPVDSATRMGSTVMKLARSSKEA